MAARPDCIHGHLTIRIPWRARRRNIRTQLNWRSHEPFPPPFPADRPIYERYVTRARVELGNGFDQAFMAGWALSWQQAAEKALCSAMPIE